jgi:hypothetical protein
MNQNKFDVAERSAKLIYKDLIKIVKKSIPEAKQGIVLNMMRKEFDKNRNLTVNKDIERLKRNAGKAIAETMIYFIKEDYLLKKLLQNESTQSKSSSEQNGRGINPSINNCALGKNDNI